jgi:hypothetical protein
MRGAQAAGMIHGDVLRFLVPAGIVSVGCAIFGWIGLFSPRVLGWPPTNPLAVNVSLAVLGLMPLLWLLAFRLHLRSLWVYGNTKPVTMNVQVKVEEDSESTRYYALLRSDPDSEYIQQVPVYPPRWNAKSIGDWTSAYVFVDPVSAKPMVIEINGERLWTMGRPLVLTPTNT